MTIEDCDPALTIAPLCVLGQRVDGYPQRIFAKLTMPERREQCSLLWIARAAAHWYAAPLDYLTI